jgi:hypothetical protein
MRRHSGDPCTGARNDSGITNACSCVRRMLPGFGTGSSSYGTPGSSRSHERISAASAGSSVQRWNQPSANFFVSQAVPGQVQIQAVAGCYLRRPSLARLRAFASISRILA